MLARTDMYNFYSSGDEVLELGPQGITVLDWDASVRQYTWHKQEAFKGRNVLYGTGWAGWGFESNVTANAVNAAPDTILRDAPVFEHYPPEMFSSSIATNMQNRILAKGIPALSRATGVEDCLDFGRIRSNNARLFVMASNPNVGWCRSQDNFWKLRWLHTDIHNIAFFFTSHVFGKLVDLGFLQ